MIIMKAKFGIKMKRRVEVHSLQTYMTDPMGNCKAGSVFRLGLVDGRRPLATDLHDGPEGNCKAWSVFFRIDLVLDGRRPLTTDLHDGPEWELQSVECLPCLCRSLTRGITGLMLMTRNATHYRLMTDDPDGNCREGRDSLAENCRYHTTSHKYGIT